MQSGISYSDGDEDQEEDKDKVETGMYDNLPFNKTIGHHAERRVSQKGVVVVAQSHTA